MRRYVWLIGFLVACDGSDEGPVDPNAQGPAVQEPVVEAPTFEDKVIALRGVSLSGQHAEAISEAETLLAEKPEDDGLWRILTREALAGDPRAVYDRLDSSRPIGGRTGPHHSLRAELALALGLFDEALSAAQAAESDALIARALKAGAVLDESAEGSAPALAVLITADKVDADTAAAAAKVSGWQAAVLRGDHAKDRGDLAGALSEYKAAAATADPRGVLAASLSRAALAQAGGEGAPSHEAAIGWLKTAAEAAISDGDGAGLAAAMSAALRLYQASLRPAEGLKAVSVLHQSVVDTYGNASSSLSGIVLARAQLSVGMLAEAHQSASAARSLLGDRAEASAAAWIEGLAAYQLGRTEGVSAAAAVSTGARKQALEALALLSSGLPASTAHPFPTTGLSDHDMAYVGVEAARADVVGAIEHLRRAVDAADATGDVTLQVYTRLAYELAARQAGHPDAASTRSQLLKLFPQVPTGLAAEVAVRAILDGEQATISGEEGPLKAWTALAAGAPVSGDVAGAGGLVEWAKGRAGGGASAYNAALADLPVHRQGALSLMSALDGSQGVGLRADLDALANEPTDIDAAMACHELGHLVDTYQDEASLGRDFTVGVPEAEREALLTAVSRARAELLYFQLGAPWPTEAVAAVAAAEAAAATASPAFKRLLPREGTSVSALRERQAGTSFLSYLDVNGSMHGVVVTPDGGAQRNVGQTARLYQAADDHFAALKASAMVDGLAEHISGNLLREALVDSFAQDLSGFGRYQVIAPTELLTFSFTTFPEQASGLRWLADIRTIAQAPNLKTLSLPEVSVELYVPDFLGIGVPVEPVPEVKSEPGDDGAVETVENPDKPQLETPSDLTLASRHFGSEFRVMLTGEEVTAEKYREHAVSARFLYLSDIDASTDGGFNIVGETLSLSEIRSILIPGKVVFISATAEPTLQVNRARAFLDAGAQAVVVVNWEIPESSMRRFVDGFYEALNRDRPVARALGDARSALLRDAMMGEEARDPALWGSIVLYGVP
ncbi:MAG: CHAT domain-containing protein [Myxococcota bacterium]|nr:CHAT domain-containing protein [Myxococcota bacterium]